MPRWPGRHRPPHATWYVRRVRVPPTFKALICRLGAPNHLCNECACSYRTAPQSILRAAAPGAAPRASLERSRPEVGHTSGFTAAAACPRWGHHSEARGVPHPPPVCGLPYTSHHTRTNGWVGLGSSDGEMRVWAGSRGGRVGGVFVFFKGARPLQRGGGANTHREIKNAPPNP